jgi:hypothetical protein
MPEYLDIAATELDLPIPPEYREEIAAAWRVLAAFGEQIRSFPLPPETEAAPRFTP